MTAPMILFKRSSGLLMVCDLRSVQALIILVLVWQVWLLMN